jgi:hypothetical protein
MRPVSIALGGVFALVLTGASAAAPLNPQPLPPGRNALNPQPLPPGSQAQNRPAQGGYLLTVCASRPHSHMAGKSGGEAGHAAGASHGAGGSKASTGCGSGKH